MKRHLRLEEVQPAPPEGRMVAIGVFDGVHLGHQRIIAEAVTAARNSGGRPTVVTFDPHPDTVLHPGSGPKALTLAERKVSLLFELGIEEVISVGFDTAFAGLPPESFCSLVLSARLGAKRVFVGENFRFGHQGAGTVLELADFGATHGFAVSSVGLVTAEGESVSSTRIRGLLDSGDVAGAAALLGRPHRVEGVVTIGAGRGRSLQAPTANLDVPGELALPGLGIYVTRVSLGGAVFHASVTSVGTNPTFEDDDVVRIETLVLDWEGDLYGSNMVIDFMERLRDQQKFADAASLSEQIRIDIAAARRVHAKFAEG